MTSVKEFLANATFFLHADDRTTSPFKRENFPFASGSKKPHLHNSQTGTSYTSFQLHYQDYALAQVEGVTLCKFGPYTIDRGGLVELPSSLGHTSPHATSTGRRDARSACASTEPGGLFPVGSPRRPLDVPSGSRGCRTEEKSLVGGPGSVRWRPSPCPLRMPPPRATPSS